MSNLNVTELRPLIAPAVLLHDLPVPETIARQVQNTRNQVSNIISGNDSRLLVIVGPCSIHDSEAALEYAEKLSHLQKQFNEQLCIIMRVYFEKPRTSIGWKGMINDPTMDQRFDINLGLRKARKLLLDINQLGVAAGTEFIDVIIPPFISDLISWGAIGARTTESQIHRQLASGLPMPIGFKNGTAGNFQIAIDAVRAAKLRHHYLGITVHGTPAIFETSGNHNTHIILRGAQTFTNFDQQSIADISTALTNAHLPPYLMVDCSHGNSGKDYQKQPIVAASLCEQIANGNRNISGVMLESHLHGGKQEFHPGKELTYGQSITDSCLSFQQTIPLLEKFADAVHHRLKNKERITS